MADQKPGEGIISKNLRKRENTNDSDISGTITCACPDCGTVHSYFLDGWLRQRKDGKGIFYSLKMKLRQAAGKVHAGAAAKPYRDPNLAPGEFPSDDNFEPPF